MASDSDNPHAMIALVIEELQRIQKHPRLQDENRSSAKQPDKETFPTYPRRVAPPDLRKAEKLYNLALVHGESRPFAQFKSQAAREIVRLEYQREHRRHGRRQTLPWDDRLGYLENAENNVRARWVEQGIWAEEWGPAWSSKNCGIPSDETDSPFHGIESSIEFCSALITRWGHESPTPVIEGTQFGFDNSKPVACLYDPDDQFTRLLMKIHLPPKPVVRNLEASRPYLQFLYQLSKERQWLEDEWHYKPPGTSLDREKAAYESVRDNWMEDSIWNYDWDALPGSRWPYEGLHPVVRDPTLTRLYRRNQHHGLQTMPPFQQPWHRPSPIPLFNAGNLPEEPSYANASGANSTIFGAQDVEAQPRGLFGSAFNAETSRPSLFGHRGDEESASIFGAEDIEAQPKKTQSGGLFDSATMVDRSEADKPSEGGLFGNYKVPR
ncbi:hypothetical protein ACJZ2D_008748 [Fusarium nematophilum]